MQVRHNFLSWGVFLVCLGAVPLAVQLNVIDRATAAGLMRLWPLILVGIGLGLLLRYRRIELIGGLVVAATLGLLGGVLLVGGVPSGATACSGDAVSGTPTTRSGIVTTDLLLNVELTCGDMTIDRVEGYGWSVDVRAGSEAPIIDSTAETLGLHSGRLEGWPFGVDQREAWQVSLPTETTLSAGLTVNAGTLHAALGGGPLDTISATYNAADGLLDLSSNTAVGLVSLSMTINASSVGVVLPANPVDGSITVNAGSLELCSATDGLRISLDETLSGNNFRAAGLVQSGTTWQSPNYATSPIHADLHVSTNLSSITLNPQGGCQ